MPITATCPATGTLSLPNMTTAGTARTLIRQVVIDTLGARIVRVQDRARERRGSGVSDVRYLDRSRGGERTRGHASSEWRVMLSRELRWLVGELVATAVVRFWSGKYVLGTSDEGRHLEYDQKLGRAIPADA